MRKHTSIITEKTLEKISQIMLLYKYGKKINNFATMQLSKKIDILRRNSGHLPPKKFDKSCNLVSSEVLLKLCFIEPNLL